MATGRLQATSLSPIRTEDAIQQDSQLEFEFPQNACMPFSILEDTDVPVGHQKGVHKEVTASSTAVTELPANPCPDACYVFEGLSRKEVTRLNHGLHKYPAKFIPQIPRWALEYHLPHPHQTVLDPFCGSGTTLVEAGIRGSNAVGYDISPLAVLISKAKAATLTNVSYPAELQVSELVQIATELAPTLQVRLREDSEGLGLHSTWSFWFRPVEMARLLAIREAITKRYGEKNPEFAVFLRACLSSVAKASSFLSEDQIKVRYDHKKEPEDPFTSFPAFAVQAIHSQLHVAEIYQRYGAVFSVEQRSATDLPLADRSVDRIVTSPPYINAVDYTMAHKYNMFLLGLIAPSDFKAHCRDYIGLTERAVRVADLVQIPATGVSSVDEIVHLLWSLNTPVSRNRAFVVAQYFSGMFAALKEMRRVLRPGGRAFLVIGNENRVCGQRIPTGALLEELAYAAGMVAELRFYHQLANRSSMRLNRSSTGGTVKLEAVYVFRQE